MKVEPRLSAPNLVWDTSEFETTDQDSLEFEWDCITDRLTEFIQKVHPDGDWHCEVNNFGWRHQNGYKDFDAGDGRKLLQEILPNTDCTFKVWLDEEAKKITIDNAHHDAPTGGEMYYVTPQA